MNNKKFKVRYIPHISRTWVVVSVSVLLAMVVLILAPSRLLRASVFFESSNNSGLKSNVSSFSWSYAVPSSNDRILIIGILLSDSTATDRVVTGITYAGANLTKIRSDERTSGISQTSLWYLVNPPVGTDIVSVALAGINNYAAGIASTLSGVDQITPIDSDNGQGSVGSQDSISTAITTVEDNALALDIVLMAGNQNLTVGAGQVLKQGLLNIPIGDFGMSMEGPKSPAGLVSMDWGDGGLTGSPFWTHSVVGLKPSIFIDTTPPSVSLTSPQDGSVVTGLISILASASDNVGVAGVQFKVDNVNLGAEDTVSPYTTSWDTTQFTDGSHTLTAVARDAAGNMTISSPVTTVTVDNTPTSSQGPNVVVIMTDELDSASLNRMVAEGLMPNLKQYIVDQGSEFLNSFVTTSLCCPSRSTFLSGQYSHNHGVYDNREPNGSVTSFNDSSTLPTWLQAGGYRTGYVGKYLNGYGNDTNSSSPKDDPTYIPPGWNDWQGLVGLSTYGVYGYTINDNGTPVNFGFTESDYQTDVLTTRANDFINESETISDTQPFFLLVNPLAPHIEIATGTQIQACLLSRWASTIRPAPRHIGTLPGSITLPQPVSFNESNISDKPSWFNTKNPLMTSTQITCAQQIYRDRLESIRAVDDMIGSVMVNLAAKGELENTIIVFTSDNGYFVGEHRITDKVYAYEESIRVPLMVRAPGYMAGQKISKFVLNNDLAPTIAEFTGVVPGLTMDGRSLVPLLANPNTAWRKRFLVEMLKSSMSIPATFFGVRTSTDDIVPDELYVNWSDGNRELYDLKIDPYQVLSVYTDPARASEISTLSGYSSNLQTCIGSACANFEN